MEHNFQFISAAVSDRGLSEKRPQNEDSFISLDNVGLYVVADGVGGAQAGDVASQMAVEILGEAFIHYGDSVDPEEIMKVAIERANEAVFQMANDLPQLSSMATTIAAVHISGNIATIAHVGDSRVYKVDTEGFLTRETNDHSVVEEEVRAGRMTPEQAANHPSRNIISRAIGAESTVEVDVKTIMVDPGTIFLLCSDGITRHISDDEISELLNTGMSPQTLCEHMKEVCYERGAEDNLTAVIVKVASQQGLNIESLAAVPNVKQEPEEVVVFEEETVASAREAYDEAQSLADPNSPKESDHLENAYQTAHSADTVNAAETVNDPYLNRIETPEYNSSSLIVEAEPQESQIERDFGMFGSSANVEEQPQQSSGSVVSKILSSFLWLVVGSIIGIAGFYFWQRSNPIVEPAPPQITEMKTNNIPLTAFEENRRLVDKDPEAYANSRAASPQDAEDHYLLGRSLLLTGKYWEAGRQFRFAKEKLGQSDQNNAKTLAADIAVGLSIVESMPSQEFLKKELLNMNTASVSNSAASNSTDNTNAATNVTTNSNTP